jgi:isopenicillin-N epimerase
VRAELATRFHLDPGGVAFVQNATAAAATVLGSIELSPGDELLVTSHGYAACHNVVTRAARAHGASVVVADVPFPLAGPEQVLEAVLARASERTRLCVVDHVTSPTALVFPVRELALELGARGIDTFVDGAHAPGCVALDVAATGAAYYAANFHKWGCAPKGAAMLYVRADRRERVRPLVPSHGMTSARRDRSRFLLEFDWTGTFDPAPYLSIPAALAFLEGLLPGGLDALMARNRDLAVEGRAALCARLGLPPPCPEGMLAAMASLPLPDGKPGGARALNRALYDRHHIECYVLDWPAPQSRLLRISAQAYNESADYQRLAEAVAQLLAA